MESPESVVQRQLDAYNAHDLEALLAVYAADAQLFEHPGRLLASGVDALRERFSARFKEPDLRATLLKRVVMGAIVIDHEEVSRTSAEGTSRSELVMIYDVQDGRIARAWVITGPKRLG